MDIETTTCKTPSTATKLLGPAAPTLLLSGDTESPEITGLKALTAADIMSEDLLTLDDGTPLGEAATFFVDNEISGAPVHDRSGAFVGVVSLTDLVRATGAEQWGAERRHPVTGWEHNLTPDDLDNLSIHEPTAAVEEIMTPTVESVPAHTPLTGLAKRMIGGRIHRLFVTEGAEIVGIVTATDVLKAIAGGTLSAYGPASGNF